MQGAAARKLRPLLYPLESPTKKSLMNWCKNITSLSSNIDVTCCPINIGRWVLAVTECYSSVTMTVLNILDVGCTSMYGYMPDFSNEMLGFLPLKHISALQLSAGPVWPEALLYEVTSSSLSNLLFLLSLQFNWIWAMRCTSLVVNIPCTILNGWLVGPSCFGCYCHRDYHENWFMTCYC